MSIQDPRERPLEAQAKADEAHRQFSDERSDFLWYLNLWRFYQEQARHLSNNKLRKLCTAHFLSYMRMREWQDIHSQIKALVHDMGFRTQPPPCPSPWQGGGYAAIHRALLTGLLGNIGFKTEKNEYTGARGVKFHLFPGSALFKKAPAWVMTAEISETSRLYARTVAEIEPEWVEETGKHLLRRSYSEPHWEKRAGRVRAFERVTLYGLTLITKRKVDYAPIDPIECRRLFIQSALVEGDLETRAAFFQHNRKRVEEVEDLQHRARRLDILADEQRLFDFYDERIPATVVDARTFEIWRAQAERADPKLLYMDRALLMEGGQDVSTEDLYPSSLKIDGMDLPLSYRFEPGDEADGVTVTVPMVMLNQLDPQPFDWLVPGLLKEKITALIRTLPKHLRRHFIPVERYAEACFANPSLIKGEEGGGGLSGLSLTASLAARLKQMIGITIPEDAWQSGRLPPYLFMNYRVVDEKGCLLAEGRDLAALQSKLGERIQIAFRTAPHWPIEREGITRWDFGTLPKLVETEQEGIRLRGFPALVDKQTSVAIQVFAKAEQAVSEGRAGVRRLIRLALPKEMQYLDKNLPGFTQMALYYGSIGSAEDLRNDLMAAILDRIFLGEENIRTQAVFESRLEHGKSSLMTTANALCGSVLEILTRFHAIQKTLRQRSSSGHSEAVADIHDQLDHLVHRGFITAIPAEWLSQIPRYLKAIALRLEKLDREPLKDRQKAARISPLWQACQERMKSKAQTPELVQFRWLLEEFRISVFAQEIKTLYPVSEARLAKLWEAIRDQ